MKKKIKRDKVEHYKISATIFTNEELERLNHKIGINLDNIVNQIIDNVYINRELIVFQKVIEKQQKEIESIKEYINSPEFLDWNLGFKLIDELEYRKDRINELLGEKLDE